jgi:phosphonate transport system substrate-binding protein
MVVKISCPRKAENMNALTISTCQAPNMDFLCRDLAGYISERLSIPVRLALDIPWQERDRLLDAGKIDLCWICGLPYIRKADQLAGRIEPLVAPVMADSRYASRPIYFSDVVVRRDSPYQSLADLQGASWAYNEPGSQSGYGVVLYALALQGKKLSYFGRVTASGSHQASLQMILRKEVDSSAIDSTVLEMEIANDPAVASQIRIIDTFGPSPIPPWVVSVDTPVTTRQALQDLLMHMETDSQGQAILKQARIARFVPVSDRDYDPIREMARIAFKE